MIKGLYLTRWMRGSHQSLTPDCKQGTGWSLLVMVTGYSTWLLHGWCSRMVLCNSLPHLLLPGQHALPAKNLSTQNTTPTTVDTRLPAHQRRSGSSCHHALAQKGRTYRNRPAAAQGPTRTPRHQQQQHHMAARSAANNTTVLSGVTPHCNRHPAINLTQLLLQPPCNILLPPNCSSAQLGAAGTSRGAGAH